MRIARFIPSRSVALVAVLLVVALIATVWLGMQPQAPIAEEASTSAEFSPAPTPAPATTTGPPWRYGRDDARFTVVEYADLECPFCRAYFAVLKHWIDTHPEVSWHAQQPERACAGVVVLHALDLEGSHGRRGSGDPLRHGSAADAHGRGCHPH